MPSVTNISAYLFAPLQNLKPLRRQLLQLCQEEKLRGTILLSTEGVNLFVAGAASGIERLLAELRAVPGLENLRAKVSESEEQPFNRMLVKIKKEIIAFGVEGIDPARNTAPKLAPAELKKWLDEGRDITLLDTRNDFEVELGTFTHAVPIGIQHFRDFPTGVQALPAEMKSRPIVMFCTGGIRCEKAGPYMQREGFSQVWQLDGGILKYFEECGGEHYQGECFVFDRRVGLDPALAESGTRQCYQCQAVVTEEDRADSRYVEGVSCPHCHRTDAERHEANRAEHQACVHRITSPLPGSIPMDNLRPIRVSANHDGWTALDLLSTIFSHTPREEWSSRLAAGRILNATQHLVSADHRVSAGDRLYHCQLAVIEPPVNAAVTILHEDDAILVIDKPAPLPVHPSGRFNRNTLQSILCTVYAPQKPRPAHRLDANTTGVIVFARTSHYAGLLQPHFERGEVEKIYLARATGHPLEDRFSCEDRISADAGDLGSRSIDAENGLPTQTDFRVLRRFDDGTALLEVIPRTGRTNQIRVHLWHLGLPIVGDQAYLPNRQLGETQTASIDDPPLCLHAHSLSFVHPVTRERVSFASPAPLWAECGKEG